MKKILTITLILLASILFSQTYFKKIKLNLNEHNHQYISIVEAEENGVKNVFTTNIAHTYETYINVFVRKYNQFGNIIGDTSKPVSEVPIKDSYFYNDTLYVIGADSSRPIIHKISSDLSHISSTIVDIEGCPWRAHFNNNRIVMLCYNSSYQTDVYTKIVEIDCNTCEVVDSNFYDGLDPWDFYIDSDTLFLSCSYTYLGDHFIKKINMTTNSIEDFIIFGEGVVLVQFCVREDKTMFVASKLNMSIPILEIYDLNGILLDSDTINGLTDDIISPTNQGNRMLVAWKHNEQPNMNTLNLKIIEEDLSVIYKQFAYTSYADTSWSLSDVYATNDNIYIYGGWEHDDWVNPYIIKSDSLGDIDPMTTIYVDLAAFLEGPFNGLDMEVSLNSEDLLPLSQPFNKPPWNYSGTESVDAIPNPEVVDWLMVELRYALDATSATPATWMAKKAGFILSDGSVVGMDGSIDLHLDVLIDENLFVVLWHRNHIGMMSASALIETGGVYGYDFTTAIGMAHLDGQKSLGGSAYGMYAGDADSNGEIEFNDLESNWKVQAGEQGYFSGDFNMNTQVNNKDKNDYWNPNKTILSQVPE